MENLTPVAWWLAVLGALNLGLVGLGELLGAGNWNVIEAVLSPIGLTNVGYVLIGLSGLWLVWEKYGNK